MRWLAAVAVAAIVGLLFFALRERAPAPRATAAEDREPAPPEAKPEPSGSDHIFISKELGGAGMPEDEGEPESETPPGRRPDPPWVEEKGDAQAPLEAPVPISGTLRVEGEGAAPSGTFRLTWDGPRDFDWDTVEVRAGAWSGTVPSGSTLTFHDIRLGGRIAIAVDGEVPVPASGHLTVVCRWFAPTVLRVVDAETGLDLAAAEIVRFFEHEWLHHDAIHPGPPSAGRARPVATGVASPVTLPEEPGKQIYWVRGQEHAWTRVEVVQSFGGERVVRLPRAGALDVRLTNFDPASGAEVRLYSETGSHLLSWPSGDRAQIESLAPAAYRVVVEVGEWFREPRRLGEARVEVEAGVVREVALDLARVPGPESLVPLAGRLRVDPGWGEEEWIYMTVEGVDVPPGTQEPDVTLQKEGSWSAGRVPPGRYAISVDPWTWCQIVEVGPSGNADVRIAVPPPCDVEVRVLMAESDEPAPVDTLNWHMQRPGGGTLQSAEAETPGRFRFRAPTGTIELGSWGTLEIEDQEMELKPGLNRITLRAQQRHGLTIELEDAVTGTKVPIDDDFRGRITVAGVDDEQCRRADWSSESGSSCTIGVTKPGRYRVTFSAEIDGFKAIDDLEVDVPAEGNARLVVRLVRK